MQGGGFRGVDRGPRPARVLAWFAMLSFMPAAVANVVAPPALGRVAAAPITAVASSVLASLRPPLERLRVTSDFGWRINPVRHRRRFHKGIDLGAPRGTPVYAAQDGTVGPIGTRHGLGHYLEVRHAGGISTIYAHLSAFTPGLHSGSIVKAGDQIARVGSSGETTGPHLHYEVISGGKHLDPRTTGSLAPAAMVMAYQERR